MDEVDTVVIETGSGGSLVFAQEYLLDWVHEELNNGKPLTDIIVSTYDADGGMKTVQLTAEIWQHSLINGLSSQSFDKYKSRRRLGETGHEYYLGQPYFEPTQVGAILSIEIMGGTVASKLGALAQKKATTYDTICGSHDHAPIFELALGVSWNSASGKCEVLHQ
ncbi:hypothetical protein MMC34_004609 [Xylographa carneopallida]|nr:hypothetical protein [Xylographa carneopallida]